MRSVALTSLVSGPLALLMRRDPDGVVMGPPGLTPRNKPAGTPAYSVDDESLAPRPCERTRQSDRSDRSHGCRIGVRLGCRI